MWVDTYQPKLIQNVMYLQLHNLVKETIRWSNWSQCKYLY